MPRCRVTIAYKRPIESCSDISAMRWFPMLTVADSRSPEPSQVNTSGRSQGQLWSAAAACAV